VTAFTDQHPQTRVSCLSPASDRRSTREPIRNDPRFGSGSVRTFRRGGQPPPNLELGDSAHAPAPEVMRGRRLVIGRSSVRIRPPALRDSPTLDAAEPVSGARVRKVPGLPRVPGIAQPLPPELPPWACESSKADTTATLRSEVSTARDGAGTLPWARSAGLPDTVGLLARQGLDHRRPVRGGLLSETSFNEVLPSIARTPNQMIPCATQACVPAATLSPIWG
jgi:hypothetical protein